MIKKKIQFQRENVLLPLNIFIAFTNDTFYHGRMIEEDTQICSECLFSIYIFLFALTYLFIY